MSSFSDALPARDFQKGRELATEESFDEQLKAVIDQSAAGLRDMQAVDGHWLFELEADATIPSEYILLKHFIDEIDPALEQKIAVYLRERQGAHGGWPLYHDGDFDLSASVKAYLALKLVGDDIESPHMVHARSAILAAGGAAKCNVFTRITLALFGQVPWRAVPIMPIEIMHLPRWFFFHFWYSPWYMYTTRKPQIKNPINMPKCFTKI